MFRRRARQPSLELEKARRETEAARQKRAEVESKTDEIEQLSSRLVEYRRLNHFTPAIELSVYRRRRHA